MATHVPALAAQSQAARDEQRVLRRAGKKSDESLREDSVAHMDARQQRLEAYADSLQAALDAKPTGEQAARLEGQLTQARKEAHAAKRRRVPRARPEQLSAQ